MYEVVQKRLKTFRVKGPEKRGDERGGIVGGGEEEEDSEEGNNEQEGSEDQKSASSADVELVTKSTVEYLRKAIRVGDRLPDLRYIEPAKRRALIVRDYICVSAHGANNTIQGCSSILGESSWSPVSRITFRHQQCIPNT